MRHFDRIVDRLEEVRRDGRGYVARCPAHDDANPSLALRVQPDGRVSLNCRSARCSVANILQSLELTFDDLSPDPDDEIIPHDDGSLIVDPTTPPSTEAVVNLDLRNRIYCGFVNTLSLSQAHKDDLNRRGLSDEQINWRVYRSLTHERCAAVIGVLRSMFSDNDLLSVPGFVQSDDGRLRIAGPRCGLLVPVLDPNGAVQALKVRRDDTSDGRGKYMYLSGGGGPSCGTPVHVPLGIQRPVLEIRLTEGELKADVATVINGPTIGLAGTSTWASALPVLQQLGVQTVRLAFDADFATKPHVARDLLRCAESLRNHGYNVSVERWPLSVAKGIDDLLAIGHQPELLLGPQAREFLSALEAPAATTTENVRENVPLEHSATVADDVPASNTSATINEELLPFPTNVFPVCLQRFAQRVAESLGCPVDLVTIPMLAGAATAIGASRALEIKPGWLESARFYMAVVAPPGSGKTPAEKHVCRPLFDAQCTYLEQYQLARSEFEAAEESFRIRGRGRRAPDIPTAIESTLATNAPSVDLASNTPGADTTSNDSTIASSQSMPAKPVLQRITAGDATTESLAPILKQNPRGIVMIRDELSGWVSSMNQYKGGKGSDCQFFLSCWSGEAASVDRKSQEIPIFVPHPFLNVLGGIQPDMLSSLCQEKNRADGFLDRILFSFPDQRVAHRWVEQGVDQEVQQYWSDTLDLLFRLEMRRCDEGSVDLPQIVEFTVDGKAAWVAWYNTHAAESESAELAEILKGPWAKLKSYCARLALVVHILRLVCRDTDDENVDAVSVSRAIQLIDYFKSHTKKVYGQLHRDQDDRRVDQVVAWIRNHGGECCIRDLARSNTANIVKMTEANKMLKDLLDRNLGHFEERPGGNGRSVTYFILN